MNVFTTVKVFDFSFAPPELQNTIESQMMRSPQEDHEAPMVAVWVGTRSSSLEQQSGASEPPKVTAWEHCLHKWLRGSGANAGDVVLLSWGGLGTAAMSEPAAAQPDGPKPRPARRAKHTPAVH